MQTIAQILTYPDKTPIDSFQARIKSVYEYQTKPSQYNKSGKTTIQNVILEAGTGETIRAGFWDHPDLKAHEGKEYVFSGGGKKGITVKHGNYKGEPTVELTINRNGTLQHLMVNPGNPSPDKAPNAAPPAMAPSRSNLGPPNAVNGSKLGGVMHDVAALLSAGVVPTEHQDKPVLEAFKAMTIELVRFSNDLESGRIPIDQEKPKAEAPKAAVEKGEDVPY